MAPQEPQRLSLTTTSLQNVVISNATDVIYYEVVTPKWEPTMTRVSKMDPKSHELEIVAELKNEVEEKESPRKNARSVASAPSAVRLRGQQFRPAGEFWTKDGSASNLGTDTRFRGKDGKHYIWRVRKGLPELVREDDPEGKPVAVYHKHKRYFMIFRMSRQPYLEVQPSVMETLDSLIVSFILMEQNRRSSKKN